jgi:beta-lactamase regulating signal transducer with metallopeptidase domain/uncharacterized membrane protein YkoI
MTSLAMSAVIVLLAVINKVCGCALSAAFKRRLWILVLFGLLIPFRPSIPAPFEPVRIPVSIASEPDEVTAGAGIEDETALSASVSASRPIPYSFILFFIWLAVAAFILGFHLWSYQRFISTIRRWSEESEESAAKPLSVRTCSFVDSPMLVGFLHPLIILPQTKLSPDELEYVLKHELTHYRRGDLWVNLLTLLVLAMHWFNPFVYLAAKLIRAESEAACDAAVVDGGDVDKRRRYGETIIGFIGARNTSCPLLSTYFMGGNSNMKKRLALIMDSGRKSRLVSVVCAAIVLSLTVLTGTAFAAVDGVVLYIGAAAAKTVALEHAGITESQATFLNAHLDKDDRIVVYDVEFYSGNTEYEYEIDAVSGEIIEYNRETKSRAPRSTANPPARTPKPSSAPVPSVSTSDYISKDEAKAFALTDAGLTEAEVTRLKVEFDRDDGKAVYEVDFRNGRMEYEYEINAVDGTIRESDAEYDD